MQSDFWKDEIISVRDSAYDIINRKGSTHYGIGTCLVRITNAILGDENLILPISSYDKNNDVFIGGPTIVNNKGARERIYVKLSTNESAKLQNSIDTLKNAINSIDIITNKKEEEIDILI